VDHGEHVCLRRFGSGTCGDRHDHGDLTMVRPCARREEQGDGGVGAGLVRAGARTSTSRLHARGVAVVTMHEMTGLGRLEVGWSGARARSLASSNDRLSLTRPW
jgi:hypothetical protein